MHEEFETREQAAKAAADIIRTAVERRLAATDEATIVLSGGTSPLGKALAASGGDLAMGRPTAVIVVSEIPGITPADLAVLAVWLEKGRREKAGR